MQPRQRRSQVLSSTRREPWERGWQPRNMQIVSFSHAFLGPYFSSALLELLVRCVQLLLLKLLLFNHCAVRCKYVKAIN